MTSIKILKQKYSNWKIIINSILLSAWGYIYETQVAGNLFDILCIYIYIYIYIPHTHTYTYRCFIKDKQMKFIAFLISLSSYWIWHLRLNAYFKAFLVSSLSLNHVCLKIISKVLLNIFLLILHFKLPGF